MISEGEHSSQKILHPPRAGPFCVCINAGRLRAGVGVGRHEHWVRHFETFDEVMAAWRRT
jgi:hypothetical protein